MDIKPSSKKHDDVFLIPSICMTMNILTGGWCLLWRVTLSIIIYFTVTSHSVGVVIIIITFITINVNITDTVIDTKTLHDLCYTCTCFNTLYLIKFLVMNNSLILQLEWLLGNVVIWGWRCYSLKGVIMGSVFFQDVTFLLVRGNIFVGQNIKFVFKIGIFVEIWCQVILGHVGLILRVLRANYFSSGCANYRAISGGGYRDTLSVSIGVGQLSPGTWSQHGCIYCSTTFLML